MRNQEEVLSFVSIDDHNADGREMGLAGESRED
jgi:hypothetical protein